jgi:hypothetical protein
MAATITTTEIVSEFGIYLGQSRNQILKLLTQPTESEKFMTTVPTKELEYRTAKAVISDVVQGFQKAWTAKGTAAFTPRTITQRRHKFDIAFYPDEVFETWLGFLADEAQDRKSWPITRYILEELVLPKVAENRELKLIGVGDYAAVVEDTPQATGLSMDGFCTQLEDALAAGTSNINFIDLDTLTDDNIFEQVENFGKSVSEMYQSISMRVFLSRYWFGAYARKRRDLHGTDVNYKADNVLVEGTNMILTPLPSMTGKGIIFATPKDNFIRVINRNEGASNIAVENVDRQIKIYADWHEAVGFGIEEAIFASVPSEASASA